MMQLEREERYRVIREILSLGSDEGLIQLFFGPDSD
jgi:hypothetical protein